MPTAVLRLAGRFRTIAYAQILANLLRVGLCLGGLWWGGDLYYFVLVWSVAQIFGAILFFLLAMLELRRQGIHRSEEHTSELQSLMRNSYAVFCLKKTT